VKKYSVAGLNQSGTGPDTCFTIIGSASIRGLISEITFGVRTNPNATDQQARFQVGTTTTAGTAGSNPTPKPLDPADPVAAVCTAGITHSAEPTYAATFYLDDDMNQRGLFRWVAETGFELGGLAVASNCIGGKMSAITAAAQMSMTAHYKE
jgi:hypothetical protein